MKLFASGPTFVRSLRGLVLAAPLLGLTALALPPGDDRPRRPEPDDPQRVVAVLRHQVEWWAREPHPVALAGEFSIDLETLESPEAAVDWTLVVTKLDREVVASWTGTTPYRDGHGIALVNFDGRDAEGHPLPSGTYVYRFEADGYEGSGGFLKVRASDELPEPEVPDALPHSVSALSPAIPWGFYFGSHHNHTTYSDGGIPIASCTGSVESAHAGADPAAAYAYAKNTAGLDFLSILDHNHIFDTACGTSCTTAQIRARYQAGLAAAASASTSSFVGIFGQEWGVISNGGHVALYEYTKLFGWDAFSDVLTTKSDYPALWNTIANASYQGPSGSMAGFCHPGSSDFGSYAQNANGIANVRAIAVISGPAFSKLETYADEGSRYAGPKAGTDRYQYVLQRGWKVGPEAHGDNHCFNFGASTRNRTVLLATSLSKANAMEAMRERRFYTSSDRNAQMFFGTADLTKVMGQTFTVSAATLDLLAWIADPDGSAVSAVTLYAGNPAAGSGSPVSSAMTNAGGGSYTATVTVPATGSAYYYVYATLANGGELFSAPIWVSRAACSDATAPTASITAPTAATVSGTVAVSATGSDNVGVTSMTLAIDGATVATSASGSVSYSWSTSGLAAGSAHTITATARDACGNTSATATRNVTIAAAAPFSISGTAGTASANVAAGSASATTDAGGAFTVSGLAAGTYTVTPSKSGCTFSPASRSVTIASASVTGVTFTATCGSAVTLFSDGFESGGWSFTNVSGTTGYWTLGTSSTHPSASPHGGTKLAAFNSYTCASGVQKRMYRAAGFAVASSYTTVSLKVWMYHDTGYSTSADKVQAQVSTNGTTWTNVGTAISRYTGSTGWTQTTVDLSAYKGQTVYLAFVGISAYGNDVYLDDVTVTAQ